MSAHMDIRESAGVNDHPRLLDKPGQIGGAANHLVAGHIPAESFEAVDAVLQRNHARMRLDERPELRSRFLSVIELDHEYHEVDAIPGDGAPYIADLFLSGWQGFTMGRVRIMAPNDQGTPSSGASSSMK